MTKNRQYVLLHAAMIILLAGFPASGLSAQRPLILKLFDVGEGDALAIESPDEKSALVDTGNLASGMGLLKEFLEKRSERLDHLLLTHPHLDHVGGVFGFLTFMQVGSVYDNGEMLRGTSRDEPACRWYEAAVRRNARYKRLARGNTLSLGGMSLRVLSPPPALLSKDWNENSLVLLLQYGQLKALLMGDANKDTEKFLLEQSDTPRDVHILKAAHHGKSDTGSKKFVEHVRPKAVLISSVNENGGSSVSRETARRYEAVGAELFLTEAGTLKVEAFPSGSFRVLQGDQVKRF